MASSGTLSFARNEYHTKRKEKKEQKKKKNRSFRHGGVSFARSVVPAHRGNDLCLYTYDALNKAQFCKIRQVGNVSLLFFYFPPGSRHAGNDDTDACCDTARRRKKDVYAQLIKKETKQGRGRSVLCCIAQKAATCKVPWGWTAGFRFLIVRQLERSFMVRHWAGITIQMRYPFLGQTVGH